jgi:hypothetical protein
VAGNQPAEQLKGGYRFHLAFFTRPVQWQNLGTASKKGRRKALFLTKIPFLRMVALRMVAISGERIRLIGLPRL